MGEHRHRGEDDTDAPRARHVEALLAGNHREPEAAGPAEELADHRAKDRCWRGDPQPGEDGGDRRPQSDPDQLLPRTAAECPHEGEVRRIRGAQAAGDAEQRREHDRLRGNRDLGAIAGEDDLQDRRGGDHGEAVQGDHEPKSQPLDQRHGDEQRPDDQRAHVPPDEPPRDLLCGLRDVGPVERPVADDLREHRPR
jgi:hypothetical protein